MSYSINSNFVVDVFRNACVNSVILESGISLTSNVFASTSPSIGSIAGYSIAGRNVPGILSSIEKFPFVSTYVSRSVGNTTVAKHTGAAHQSRENGYFAGGIDSSNVMRDTIDKFSFTTDSSAYSVGCLTLARRTFSGVSSLTDGYNTGGQSCLSPDTSVARVDKFPFAADSNSTCLGNLQNSRKWQIGNSSYTNGYVSGGPIPTSNCMERFPFAYGSVSTSIFTLNIGIESASPYNSSTNGYIAGGYFYPTNSTLACIQKFPYASDTPSSVVGCLTSGLSSSAGSSSSTHGYTSGGYNYTTSVQRFSFASEGLATCIGALTTLRGNNSGTQV